MKTRGKAYIRLILRVLMALCTLGILLSAFILFKDSREHGRGDAAYQQLRLVKEDIDEVDFRALERINSDSVAWITCEGTEIDYPVVKGRDNIFYLHHLFNGEPNMLGSIFMDYRNHNDFSDKNTVIYGHNISDGSMFFSFTKYKKQEYYDKFPKIQIYTPACDFTIELFAGIVVKGDYEYVRFKFRDKHDFQNYIDSLIKKSTFKSKTSVKADDQIVTFSTCTYEFDNARYLLFGILKPKKNTSYINSP